MESILSGQYLMQESSEFMSKVLSGFIQGEDFNSMYIRRRRHILENYGQIFARIMDRSIMYKGKQFLPNNTFFFSFFLFSFFFLFLGLLIHHLNLQKKKNLKGIFTFQRDYLRLQLGPFRLKLFVLKNRQTTLRVDIKISHILHLSYLRTSY